MTAPTRVVLVDSAPGAPGLLGHAGWQALHDADVVLLRDPATHPAVHHLAAAGLGVDAIPQPALEVRDRRDLLAPGVGDVGERQRAQGLCALAELGGAPVTVLLGPGDDELGRAVGLEAARRGVEVEWVFLAELPAGGELLRLAEVQRRLRDPVDGCPWDLEQDHQSLARYLVEETYEAVEAIAGGDDAAIVEELGDVLLQVLFHAQIAQDRRAFSIDDVARGIADKLVARHPHVFGDAEVADADEVVANWQDLKAAEKPDRDGPFDGVPRAQPAMPLAAKLLQRARQVGVAWPDATGAADKVREELDEVLAATGDEDRRRELGDLLHAVVALATTLDADPELALRIATDRFVARVEWALQLASSRGLDLAALPPADRQALLDEARDRVEG